MTINKSQGQTLQKVGLDLTDDVFTHGQLYVALSRTTSREYILCLVKTNRLIDNVPHVANVVFRKLILAATGREPLYLNVDSSGNGKSNKAIPTPTATAVATRTVMVTTTTTVTTARAVATTTATNGPYEIGDGACLFLFVMAACMYQLYCGETLIGWFE